MCVVRPLVVMVVRRHCKSFLHQCRKRVFKLNVKPSVTLPLTLQYLNFFRNLNNRISSHRFPWEQIDGWTWINTHFFSIGSGTWGSQSIYSHIIEIAMRMTYSGVWFGSILATYIQKPWPHPHARSTILVIGMSHLQKKNYKSSYWRYYWSSLPAKNATLLLVW